MKDLPMILGFIAVVAALVFVNVMVNKANVAKHKAGKQNIGVLRNQVKKEEDK